MKMQRSSNIKIKQNYLDLKCCNTHEAIKIRKRRRIRCVLVTTEKGNKHTKLNIYEGMCKGQRSDVVHVPVSELLIEVDLLAASFT